MPRLLIIEDETAIRELMAFICETDGFETVRAATLAEARAAMAAELPALVLLDVMLPDGSGFEWLAELKRSPGTAGIPVILVTARGAESDRVRGLDTGADDYIVKPFLPRELIARVRAVLRRSGQGTPASAEPAGDVIVTAGPLTMNETRFEATVDGVPLKLSVKEFRLLFLFASRPGRVYTREMLLENVWGNAFVDERTVDVHMLRLRKVLGAVGAESLIETVRGVGYRFRSQQ